RSSRGLKQKEDGMRLLLIPSLILGLSMAQPTYAEGEREATLYKNPQCGCCEGYAYFLRKAGFTVTVVSTHDLPLIKREHGVPDALEGCHTTIIDGYVIEGQLSTNSLVPTCSKNWLKPLL